MSEIFSAKVRDISSQGLGVADHPDGRSFFIRGTWPGDEGEFEIESIEKKYGFAKIHKLSKFSEFRTDNPCAHSGLAAGKCGGCPWLGIKYSAQLEQKQKMVTYLLKRTGAFEEGVTKVLPILPSPKEIGYRNRAQFKTDSREIGFVSPGTKILAPIQDCLMLTDKNRETLQGLRAKLPNQDWLPTDNYLWNYLEIDEDIGAGEVNKNQRRTFKQANDAQNANMKTWLKDKLAREDKNQTVIELFCGSGNFTEVISQQGFKKIVASEVDERAVKALNQKNFPNTTGIAANLFFPSTWKNIKAEGREAEILVLDPPRDGFRQIAEFVDSFKKLKKMYYISCEASHFASEIRGLKRQGWTLREVQPVDQFPHTAHVEILGEIVKN